MNRLLLLLILAAPLAAHDLALSAPDGASGWLLLQPTPGRTGAGMSEFATDPGLPVPDILRYPTSRMPLTDLWRFENGKYTRLTDLRLGVRALHGLFALPGKPHVLLYQPGETQTRVLNVAALPATPTERLPDAAVALALPAFCDRPALSPDGKLLVLRAFAAEQPTLRVYDTTTWALVAESAPANFSRPVWCGNRVLACLAYDAPGHRVEFAVDGRRNENPAPLPGRLLRLDLGENALTEIELLRGEFPPETFTRALAADPLTGGIAIARREGGQTTVELRARESGAEPREVARFEHFRGLAVGGLDLRAAGVRDGRLVLFHLRRWSELRLPVPGATGDVRLILPGTARQESAEMPLAALNPDGLGGLIDMGAGVYGLLESAAHPTEAGSARHTLVVPAWRGCDSLRNPRNLAALSLIAARFAELEQHYLNGIPSTLLAFDLSIALPNTTPKQGRYVELFHAGGRGGKGRIRVEDNLSGNWLVNAIDGTGEEDGDSHYSSVDIRQGAGAALSRQAAAAAGKDYTDLVTRLEARQLLLLNGIDRALDKGGMRFLGRSVHRDLIHNVTRRVWVFEKFGRPLAGGGHERAVLRFVADPGHEVAHPLLHAQLRFAMADGQDSRFTELSFDPLTHVRLPNLTDKAKPELLLPREFRVLIWDDAKGQHIEQLRAVALEGELAHPEELITGGRLKPGYYVPGLGLPALPRVANVHFQNQTRP